ncbi:MAG: tyrosine-type recombinase/integrase [Chloroflexi bacterium]|nr:tyrosine-type recombinase/integrase [Chloroflexota bacterium]MXZ53158.1 tyrosine-type recombinase/integrase [Acidimicrobiaceae bacterium]MYI86713.1 tyrosine-type recombinase/integrase [Dehalococcoidia bacterium]
MSSNHRRPAILTAAFVRTINRPGRYGDGRGGHGLSLLVKPMANGRWSKTWSQRVKIGGKVTSVGLGSYPVITLAEARARALENARAVAAGKDPRTGDAPSVAEAWEQVIRLRRPSWRDGGKSEAQWRASFRDYVEPQLGSKLVSEVTTADLLAVLLPHWHERAETMRRVKQRLGAVLGWALAQGHRDDNPARSEALTAALPKQPAGSHQRALPPEEVPAAVAAIRVGTASLIVKLAVEFVVLTGCRSGEARNATWDEIDGDTWTIPGERTKTGKPHRIPLSSRALELLNEARELGDGAELIFAAPRTGKPLSDNTLGKALRTAEIPATIHGMRASLRDWLAAEGVPYELAEAVLAHQPRGIAKSYRRDDLLEARRPIMERWANHVAG